MGGKRMRYLKIVAFIGCLVLIVQSFAQAEVVFWNKLGSEEEILNSEIGPGIQQTSYKMEDWEEARIIPGRFGNGLFINHDTNEGWSDDGANFFAIDLDQTSLTLAQGTIEFWFKFLYNSGTHNHAYFFQTADEFTNHFWDGYPWDFSGGYSIQFAGSWNGWDYGEYGKRFGFYAGNSSANNYITTPDFSAAPGGALDFETGTFMHFAFVWNANGIDDTADTMRIYVDGKEWADSQAPLQTTGDLRRFLYLGSMPNKDPWDTYYNGVKGVTDNLIIRDDAITDFSHRFNEDPLGEVPSGERLEVGEVEVDHRPVRVDFSHPFKKPVVVTHMTTRNGWHPCVVRVDEIDQEGFTVQIQEYEYLNGSHLKETVTYMVMEEGVAYLPDGTQIEAGRFSTHYDWQFRHNFQTGFVTTPVVMTSIVTKNGWHAVTGRTRDLTIKGFDYLFQEQEANNDGHVTEEINYIAWEPGQSQIEITDSEGNMATTWYEVGTATESFNHEPTSVVFDSFFTGSPFVLADMQSANGLNTATLAVQTVTDNELEVWVEEETSADEEVSHVGESVGFIRVLVKSRSVK